MTTFAAISGTSTDGVTYSINVSVPASEADLFNRPGLTGGDPAPTLFSSAVAATVSLSVSGSPTSNSTYVVMQTDLTGTWFDIAWLNWTDVSGSVTFVLCAGAFGAAAFRSFRSSGVAPQGTEAIQCPLGGRIRFVGQATLAGGTTPVVSASIMYRMLGLR